MAPPTEPIFQVETFRQILKDLQVLIDISKRFDAANPIAKQANRDCEKHEKLMLIQKDAQKGNPEKDAANAQLEKSLKIMVAFFEEVQVDASSKKIVDEFLKADVMAQLIKHIRCLDFMNEKRTIDSFAKLCQNYTQQFKPYIQKKSIFQDLLVNMDDLWVNQGARDMLEALCKQESMCTMTLDATALPLLRMARYDRLEEVGTALQGLKVMLSSSKKQVGSWLETNYVPFFSEIDVVLRAVDKGNDASSLFIFQVIEEILSNLADNAKVARRYCDDAKACDLILKMLIERKNDSTALNIFNVFKFFVCFEPRSPGVQKILQERKAELVKFFNSFQKQRMLNDSTFREDRVTVVAALENIK